jgi:hypothetical protein
MATPSVVNVSRTIKLDEHVEWIERNTRGVPSQFMPQRSIWDLRSSAAAKCTSLIERIDVQYLRQDMQSEQCKPPQPRGDWQQAETESPKFEGFLPIQILKTFFVYRMGKTNDCLK